nr:hypothetical protein [uncultured Cetobacterium sp.]
MSKGEIILSKNNIIQNATFSISKTKEYNNVKISTVILGEFFFNSFFSFSKDDSTKLTPTSKGFIFIKYLHYENDKLCKVWSEVFKVAFIEGFRIVTEANERKEFFDLNWDCNSFILKDFIGLSLDFV